MTAGAEGQAPVLPEVLHPLATTGGTERVHISGSRLGSPKRIRRRTGSGSRYGDCKVDLTMRALASLQVSTGDLLFAVIANVDLGGIE